MNKFIVWKVGAVGQYEMVWLTKELRVKLGVWFLVVGLCQWYLLSIGCWDIDGVVFV